MQLKPFDPSLSFEYPFGPSTYTVALSATGGPADSANAICTSGEVWASILRTAASVDPSTGPDSKMLSETNGNSSIDAPPWQAVAPMRVGRTPEGCTGPSPSPTAWDTGIDRTTPHPPHPAAASLRTAVLISSSVRPAKPSRAPAEERPSSVNDGPCSKITPRRPARAAQRAVVAGSLVVTQIAVPPEGFTNETTRPRRRRRAWASASRRDR